MNINFWFLKGIFKGIKTGKFPKKAPLDIAPWSTALDGKGNVDCPVEAIKDGEWNFEKCIFCRRCLPEYAPNGDTAIYKVSGNDMTFKKSFHLFPLDSGACGACNVELHNIAAPQYDMTRLGIFFTNTPRHADAIVIMGVWTEGMGKVLERALEAMPGPKLVIAMGACAISGGIIGTGVTDKINADVVIGGCPPNPYTILSALMKARGE